MKVARDASVHPQTVSEVTPEYRGMRGGRSRRPPTVGDTRHVRVEPWAWVTALYLADGDARRLEVVDALTVMVHNHTDWRTRR